MEDRKKVIEALRVCSADTPTTCKGCPFDKQSAECIIDLMRAALELIEGGQQEAGANDFVSRQYLLAEYDRQHQGPPGGARKIIEEAPAADVVDCEGFGIWQESFDPVSLGSLGSDWVDIQVTAWRPLHEAYKAEEDNG